MAGPVRWAVRLVRPTGGSCGCPQWLRGGVGLPVPGQQLVQLMALGAAGDDALQHIAQPGQWIETIQLRRGEKRGEDRPVAGTMFRTRKEVVPPSERYRAHRALYGIRVDFDASVGQEQRQAVPIPEGVADRF